MTFVGVGVALVVINTELGLCTLTVVDAAGDRHRRVPPEGRRLYDLSRERIAIVNADFQESLSGVREAQAFVHEDADHDARSTGSAATTSSRGSPPSAWWRSYFPFVQFLSGGRRRHRARRRRAAGRAGSADLRRADRLHPLHRPVLLADPAALAGVRLLAADPGVGRADRRADAARDADARPGRRPSSPGRLRGELVARRRPLLLSGRRRSAGRPFAERRASGGARPTPACCSRSDADWRKPPEALRGIDLRGRRPGRPSRWSARPAPASRR